MQVKVHAGQCLICEANAEVRGLCDRHYRTFLRRLRGRGNPEAQAEFESRAIHEGLILPVQQVRALKGTDPFSDL